MEGISILMLNNDCLLSIFQYLNIQELMVTESVCQRFKGIAVTTYRIFRKLDYHEITLDKAMTLQEAEAIATRVGPYVHNLKISHGSIYAENNDIPMSVLVHFVNLQSIYLDNYHIRKESHIEMLSRTFFAIKYIVLDFCDTNDDIEEWFNNAKHLEVLKLINIHKIRGWCIAELKGIKELKLYNCYDILPYQFYQFCKGNPQLSKLSLYLDIVQEDNQFVMHSIANHLKNLENLVLWDISDMFDTYGTSGPNFEILADLPNIKRLRICYTGHEDSTKLDFFLEHMAKKNCMECLNLGCGHYNMQRNTLDKLKDFMYLKTLILNYVPNCDRTLGQLTCWKTLEELHLIGCVITPKSITQLIQQFKALKLINLSQCSNFDASFLETMEECLCQRAQVLEIVVNKTPIGVILQKDPQSEFIQEFTEKMQRKVKFTINSNEDGTSKKFFHEWEDWVGDYYH